MGIALSCGCLRHNGSEDLSDISGDIYDIFDDEDILREPQIIRTTPLFSITLCRYDSGKLLRSEWGLGEQKYIAVSHVWGAWDHMNIPGIDGKVKVSKEKVRFITDRLPDIIKDEWFWM